MQLGVCEVETRIIDSDPGSTTRMYLDLEKYAGLNVGLSFLFVLDGSLEAAEVRRAVNLLKDSNPRFSQQIGRGPTGSSAWTATRDDDMLEFVELSPGAGIAEVLERGDHFQAAGFSDDGPRWRAIYFAPMTEGRSALLLRLHHGFGDGSSVLAMIASAFGVKAPRVRWVEVEDGHRGGDSVSDRLRSVAGAVRHVAGIGASLIASKAARRRFFAELEPLRRRDDGRGGRHASRNQTMMVLDARPGSQWDEFAAKHGVRRNDVFVSLTAGILHDYWIRTAIVRDEAVVAVPVDMKSRSVRGDELHTVHVEYVSVGRDLLGPAGLRSLSGKIVRQFRESARTTQEASPLITIIDMLPGPVRAYAYARGSAMTDLLASNVGAVPTMAIGGLPVTAFSAFAPAMEAFASFVLIEHEGIVRLCANVDRALVTDEEVFAECAENAVRGFFGETRTEA